MVQFINKVVSSAVSMLRPTPQVNGIGNLGYNYVCDMLGE